MPFWPALDRLLDLAGMTVYPYAERPAIEMRRRGAGTAVPAAAGSAALGPLRIEPSEVTARRGLRRRDDRSLAVAVEVAWEPRVRLIRLVNRCLIVSDDDRGRPAAGGRPRGGARGGRRRSGHGRKVRSAVAACPRRRPRDRQPQGQIDRHDRGQSADLSASSELSDAKSVTKRIAAVTVTLEGVQKTEEGSRSASWFASTTPATPWPRTAPGFSTTRLT